MQWDEDLAKIIDDKINAFKKYTSSESIEDKQNIIGRKPLQKEM